MLHIKKKKKLKIFQVLTPWTGFFLRGDLGLDVPVSLIPKTCILSAKLERYKHFFKKNTWSKKKLKIFQVFTPWNGIFLRGDIGLDVTVSLIKNKCILSAKLESYKHFFKKNTWSTSNPKN